MITHVMSKPWRRYLQALRPWVVWIVFNSILTVYLTTMSETYKFHPWKDIIYSTLGTTICKEHIL